MVWYKRLGTSDMFHCVAPPNRANECELFRPCHHAPWQCVFVENSDIRSDDYHPYCGTAIARAEMGLPLRKHTQQELDAVVEKVRRAWTPEKGE